MKKYTPRYKADISSSKSSEVGKQVVVEAANSNEAREVLEEIFGSGSVMNIHDFQDTGIAREL